MSKELILAKIEELGFSIEEAGDFGYVFKFEELTILYMPDDDENFLRFAVPNIYDVTDENKRFVLEVVNDTNMSIKYSKTCVYGDSVWVFYEYRLFGEDNLEDIIEHSMLLLQASYFLFHRKLEGDDTLPGEDEDDDDNNNETKEDE
jgi:hypothetical protein